MVQRRAREGLGVGGLDKSKPMLKSDQQQRRVSRGVHTLFSAFVGVTHDGRASAASIRRNSPSESITLEKCKQLEYAEGGEDHLIATSHFALISLSNQTAHHSSSTQSPTLIRPSSFQPSDASYLTTFSSKGSRCHRWPGSKDST